jgi:hypothetical protein
MGYTEVNGSNERQQKGARTMEGNHMVCEEIIKEELAKKIARAEIEWRLRHLKGHADRRLAVLPKRALDFARRALPAKPGRWLPVRVENNPPRDAR